MNSNFNTLPGLVSDKAHTMNKATVASPDNEKSLESWIWDAACSIRGTKDAPKYKDLKRILKQLGVGAQSKRTTQ